MAAVHANGRPRSNRSKMDGRDRSGPRRFTAERPDGVSDDVIDGGGGSAGGDGSGGARSPANGGTRTQTEGTGTKRAARRTHRRPKRRRRGNGRRRRRGGNGGALRVDDGDDAPVVSDGGEGADEDGDATAITTAVFPSDGDGWSDGGARLERRRRRLS